MIDDVVRVVGLAAYTVVAGLTCYIIVIYYQAHRRRTPGERGLLPQHVWLLGVSHLLLATAVSFRILTRFGEPVSVTAGLGAVGLAVSVYGLALVLRFESRRERGG